MRIDRNKLNSLLRSGLNSEIKTRKQLAAHLSLDPTSLTRWFATRDRLGNPRYPVVPDRHVTKILQLFNLDPQSLQLDDEEFRHYCFEQSLSQTNHHSELEQKNKLRLEKALQRKIDITDYSTGTNTRAPLIITSLAILILIAGFFTSRVYFNNLATEATDNRLVNNELECWTGYSPSLGFFDEKDEADPCHYGKLFHNALMQLKSENDSLKLLGTKAELSGTHAYILFLFEQLEYRRIRDNIMLNIELGKSEMHRSNYQAAQSHFFKATEMLRSLPEVNTDMLTEISIYTAKIAKQLP
ncbi:hypothetical protein AAD001_07500 [Colwelliaceae bacterium 6471]